MDISFGDRLRIAREQIGLNQSELAKHIGVQAAAISKYEKGNTLPNVETLAKICNFLDVSADWLLGLERPVPEGELTQRVEALPREAKDRVNGYLDALGY